MDIFYNLSHYVPLLLAICPTQGYPLRFLALTHYTCTTHRILGTIPPRSHANASFYMLLILELRPPLCTINPQHQSLIEPNTSKNTKPIMMQSLAQWKSNSNYRSLQALDFTQSTTNATKTTNPSFFAFELSFLYSSYNILFPYLQRPWPPIICCQPVPHNTQTKFPT